MVDAHNAARSLRRRRRGSRRAARPLETGAATARAVLDVGRAVAAAELLGVADEVFERTLAYLKERKQFERLIGEFQALQHRCRRRCSATSS